MNELLIKELSVKEVATELSISDKAVYKRISSSNFDKRYIKKRNGKTYITKDGLEYLKATKKKLNADDEVALTITEAEAQSIKKVNDNEGITIYSAQDIDMIKMLKGEVEYLKNQLEQQSFNHQEQMKMQIELQKDTIKSKDRIILSMQDIIKTEQEVSKKILDYDERAKVVDNKLLELREELNNRSNVKRKKSFFSFFRRT